MSRINKGVSTYRRALNKRDPVTKERIFTKTEEKIFGVLVNPLHYQKSNREKMVLIGCSHFQFYKIIRNPWFMGQVKQAAMALITGDVMPIIQTAIESAKEKGRDGFSDRKMLLEMAGYYNPQKQINVNVEGEITGEVKHQVNHVFDSKKFKELYVERTTGSRPGLGASTTNNN